MTVADFVIVIISVKQFTLFTKASGVGMASSLFLVCQFIGHSSTAHYCSTNLLAKEIFKAL